MIVWVVESSDDPYGDGISVDSVWSTQELAEERLAIVRAFHPRGVTYVGEHVVDEPLYSNASMVRMTATKHQVANRF